jgi:hypothetical protein
MDMNGMVELLGWLRWFDVLFVELGWLSQNQRIVEIEQLESPRNGVGTWVKEQISGTRSALATIFSLLVRNHGLLPP